MKDDPSTFTPENYEKAWVLLLARQDAERKLFVFNASKVLNDEKQAELQVAYTVLGRASEAVKELDERSKFVKQFNATILRIERNT